MIRAFSTAASGLVAQTVKQDVIANNIANVQTAGFKRQKTQAVSFEAELNNKLARTPIKDRAVYPNSPVASRVVMMGSSVDSSQGPITNTGVKTDVAIEGPGAFVVSHNGQTSQTRAGNFQINASGELCAADGALVMGQMGPIRVPDADWTIGPDGTVMDSAGSAIDRIQIEGGSEKTSLKQGSLEQANVSIVREMVDMIANMRSYEANQKVISSVDGTLEKLINDVGKV